MPPQRLKLTDIARLAGVSRATASYVINGQARARRISDETINHVMAVVERSGFRIDAQAAALRRGASRTLGLIVPDLENASYARLTKLIERGSRQQGYQLLITDSDDEPATERELALSLRAQGCAALIVATCLPDASDFYAPLQDSGLPVIALDRPMDPERFICVVSENEAAAEQLTRSLLTPLPASLAWLDAMPQLGITLERRQGFAAAVAGLPIRNFRLCGQRYDRASGLLLGRQLLQAPLPEAIVTASYPLLAGLFDAFLETGQGLPQDLRIATFGDDRLLDFIPLPVHSMPQRHAAIAGMVLECAIAATRKHYLPGRQTVSRQLRLREDRPSRSFATTYRA